MQDDRNYGTPGGGAGGAGGGPGSTGGRPSGTSTGSGAGMGGGTAGASGGTATGNRLGGVEQLQERADGMMEGAAERLEHVADRIDTVAEMIPKKGVGQKANDYGHTAADTLESVARWLRDNDTATLQRELGGLVANRPLSMLLLAVGVGYVTGKVLR